MNVDLRVGVDVKDSLLHHVNLVFSDAGAGSDDLPVQVCQAHFVVVHKVNMLNAGTNQRLHRVASNAANSKDRDSRPPQNFHRLFSQKQLCPRKLV